MFEVYETLTTGQKNTFAEICNKLLSNTFICRDKRDNHEAYYFVISYKDLFDEYFKIMGMELVVNRDTGSIYLSNPNNQTTLKLKRDESVVLLILRLLYHEKLKETSLNDNIVIRIGDIHDHYDTLEIKKKLGKTELMNMLRLFKRFNLIDSIGDLTMSATQIIIYPTILDALKTREITEISNTLAKLSAEGGED